jgi:hypothetical protein
VADETEVLDRPIWGAEAIAKVIDRTPTQTYYLLRTGKLPAKQVGDRWVTTLRRLRSLFTEDAA